MGLSQPEYNAMIHAIWRIDRAIEGRANNESAYKLKEQRQTLSELFQRLTN